MAEKGEKTCKAFVQVKEQSEDEYEREMQKAVQKVSRLAASGQSGQIEKEVEGILDKVQNLAFMDGYQYAITVLAEGLRNMKA